MTIGVGIITCDRPELFERSIQSLPKADLVVVVNDGQPLSFDLAPLGIDFLIQHDHHAGVTQSKNDALEVLLQEGVEHIFLMEDDVIIKNRDVYQYYIKAAQSSGIRHFNFCLASPHNQKRYAIKYNDDGVGISFFRNLYQPWAYFHRSVLEEVGLFDTAFYNALGHVDHTYRIIKTGLYSPYWWFADISGSNYLLETLDPSFSQSLLKKDPILFRRNMTSSIEHFIQKHGVHPARIPDVLREEVRESLRQLFYKKCSRVLQDQ